MAPQLLPHFRLLSKAIGKLEEIDAVLGCPLWLPNINEDFDQMSPSFKRNYINLVIVGIRGFFIFKNKIV